MQTAKTPGAGRRWQSASRFSNAQSRGQSIGLTDPSGPVQSLQAWLASSWRILTLPPEISPSPRQPSAGRGLGRGASTGLQTWAAVAFRQGGLLSPALSSKGGEGGPVVGWWQCQDALTSG